MSFKRALLKGILFPFTSDIYTIVKAGEYTKKIQMTSGIFHGIPRERAFNNYFTPCHRKYSGQHNQCDIRASHEKVECNTVLFSDWLYFDVLYV